MLTKLRIPTLDQYAYIEVEFEGTTDEAIEEYNRLTQKIKGGVGLVRPSFNKILDKYLIEETMSADDYGAMSLDQQTIIQEIKKSKARTK